LILLLDPSDLDKAFLQEMVVHHEGAVEMANMILKTAFRNRPVFYQRHLCFHDPLRNYRVCIFGRQNLTRLLLVQMAILVFVGRLQLLVHAYKTGFLMKKIFELLLAEAAYVLGLMTWVYVFNIDLYTNNLATMFCKVGIIKNTRFL
jgi:hypothetical protein